MATVSEAAETRIVLRNISWNTYESILADHESASAPRFSYDRGELEIMSPQAGHEECKWAVMKLVEIVADERGIELLNLGSTTFRREDLERGFEPDACFYFEHHRAMKGRRRLDLRVDPAPELVIEIDITRPLVNKLGIFAAFAVPEVWRFNGERLTFLVLEDGRYAACDTSRALPMMHVATTLAQVTAYREAGTLEWLRQAHEWAQSLRRTTESNDSIG